MLMNKKLYRGEDAMSKCFQNLEGVLIDIREDLKNIRTLVMPDADWKQYNHADTCWICKGSCVSCKKGDKGDKKGEKGDKKGEKAVSGKLGIMTI